LQKRNKILILLFVLISGCGLRDVEAPVDPRSNFIPPTSPDIVITNIQSAIIERNINNYISCFVDSNFSTRRFTYTADASSLSQYPIFRFWLLNNERYYFTSLTSLTPAQSISNLLFSNIVFTPSSDTAVFDADYVIRFEHIKQNVPRVFQGKLRFLMAADSRNLWSIYNWTDFKRTESDTTWSVLKANFSN
jgi:hypothetical protein